jgi:hypothetical protein
LEVKYTNKSGDEYTGDTSFEFDATGFKAGCSVETPPRFVAQKEQAPEPAPPPPPPPPPEETKTPARPRSAPKPAEPADKPAEDEVVKPPDSSDYAP